MDSELLEAKGDESMAVRCCGISTMTRAPTQERGAVAGAMREKKRWRQSLMTKSRKEVRFLHYRAFCAFLCSSSAWLTSIRCDRSIARHLNDSRV